MNLQINKYFNERISNLIINFINYKCHKCKKYFIDIDKCPDCYTIDFHKCKVCQIFNFWGGLDYIAHCKECNKICRLNKKHNSNCKHVPLKCYFCGHGYGKHNSNCFISKFPFMKCNKC